MSGATLTTTGRRVRRLAVPRTDAIGWDLPEGHADEPPELAGRTALAARYLGTALAGSGSAAGWTRKHRLTGHASCFSFWSPGATVANLAGSLSTIDPSPPAELLARLVTAQLAQASAHRAHPAIAMFRTVREAAWGPPPAESLGDAGTLAAARTADFPGYLRHYLTTARPVTVATPLPDPPPAGPPAPRWQGRLLCVDRPGQQCRIAVQVHLAPGVDDPVPAAVLAALLDGSDGLVHRRLRTEAGIAYGTVATVDDEAGGGSVIIGASLLWERLPAAVAGIRGLLEEMDREPLPAEALDRAARAVRDTALGRLDEPFGALDNHRRRLAGLPCASRTATGAAAAAERLRTMPRLSDRHRPAIGYLGPLDGTRELLEELW